MLAGLRIIGHWITLAVPVLQSPSAVLVGTVNPGNRLSPMGKRYELVVPVR